MAKKSAKTLGTAQRKKWLTLLRQSAENTGLGSHADHYRFVIDSNIWISALLFGGEPERVIEDALTHEVVLSEYIISEIFNYLRESTVRLPHRWLKALRMSLSGFEYLENDGTVKVEVRDSKDEPIVRLAHQYGAVIITGDKDLLEIDEPSVITLSIGQYRELFL